MFVHAVARCVRGVPSPIAGEVAWFMWRRLRERCGNALAAVLMPDHLHVITPCESPSELQSELGHVLAGVARFAGRKRLWLPVPEPRLIPDRSHLLRQIRYVHLNPCRARLARDPLAWPWSTHRGVLGAEVDPWVDARRLADAIGWREAGFGAAFHARVSGDPTVHVGGTAPPRAAEPRVAPAVPLQVVVDAAWSATPWSPEVDRRAAFVVLARHQGWCRSAELAAALGVGTAWIRKLARRDSRASLAPAALCLGDPRLRLPASACAPALRRNSRTK